MDLLRRHHRGVEEVQVAVVSIGHPDFALVSRQPNAMTWAAMTFHRATLESLHFDTMQLLAGLQIANLETQQVVDIHKTKGLVAIDRERTNVRGKRSHTLGR